MTSSPKPDFKMRVINPRAFLLWALIFVAGYCFGGKVGVGIAAVIILLAQVFV